MKKSFLFVKYDEKEGKGRFFDGLCEAKSLGAGAESIKKSFAFSIDKRASVCYNSVITSIVYLYTICFCTNLESGFALDLTIQ